MLLRQRLPAGKLLTAPSVGLPQVDLYEEVETQDLLDQQQPPNFQVRVAPLLPTSGLVACLAHSFSYLIATA
jgi:hypothetical protein